MWLPCCVQQLRSSSKHAASHRCIQPSNSSPLQPARQESDQNPAQTAAPVRNQGTHQNLIMRVQIGSNVAGPCKPCQQRRVSCQAGRQLPHTSQAPSSASGCEYFVWPPHLKHMCPPQRLPRQPPLPPGWQAPPQPAEREGCQSKAGPRSAKNVVQPGSEPQHQQAHGDEHWRI